MRRALADFLIASISGAMPLLIVLALLALSGCASGVQMTDEEAVACRNEGCAVFTERELDALVRKALEAGYRKGWSNAVRESMGEGI